LLQITYEHTAPVKQEVNACLCTGDKEGHCRQKADVKGARVRRWMKQG